MRPILWLSAAGVAFSGILTILYYAGLCFGGCTMILGLPSCVYGLMMFTILLALAMLQRKNPELIIWIMSVGAAGTVFSLTLALKEMEVCALCYPLLLPNCAYGFIVFFAITIIAYNKGYELLA